MNERDLVRGVGEIEEWIVQEAEEQPVRLRKRKWNFAPATGFVAAAMVVVSISWATIWMNHKNTLVDQEISSVAEMTEGQTVLIPIEAEERLMICREDGNLLIYDRNGKLVDALQSTGWMGTPEAVAAGKIVSSKDVILIGVTEKDKEASGMYSMEINDWIVEPKAGVVMTQIGDNEDCITDGSRIFDRNGVLTGTISEGKIIDSWNGGVLVEAECGEDGIYSVYDVCGELIQTMEPGVTFAGRCAEYLNWTDQDGGGLVTDLQMNHVMTEEEFWQLPHFGSDGKGFAVVSSSLAGENRLLVKTKEWNGSGEKNVYLICDEGFEMTWLPPSPWTEVSGIWANIADGEFSEDEWLSEDSEVCLGSWVVLDEGEKGIYVGRLEDKTICRIPYYEDGYMVSHVKGYEGMKPVLYVEGYAGGKRIESFLIDGETMVDVVDGSLAVEYADDMVYIAEIGFSDGQTERRYYLPDGAFVKEYDAGIVYYAGAEFYCAEDDDGIYVKKYEEGEKVYLNSDV